MADIWSVEFAIKEVCYWQIYSYELTFSFWIIKARVYFRNFSAERKMFNFAQVHILKTQPFLFLELEFFFKCKLNSKISVIFIKKKISTAALVKIFFVTRIFGNSIFFWSGHWSLMHQIFKLLLEIQIKSHAGSIIEIWYNLNELLTWASDKKLMCYV